MMLDQKEINDCLQVLQTEPRWFFQSKQINEKVICLQKIATGGRSHLIGYIINVLRSNNDLLSNTAADTIITLFKNIRSKNQYESCLKYLPMDLPYLAWIKGKFTRDQTLYLQAMASFNQNGYVRERAIIDLGISRHAGAIPFLTYRLVDWVKPVREKAREQLAYFLAPAYILALTENLPILERLKKVARVDLTDIFDEVVRYLLSKENLAFVTTHYYQLPERTRFILAKALLSRPTSEPSPIELLLKDRSFLIKNLLASQLDGMEEITKQYVARKLLKDRVARIRLNTYYQILHHKDFEEEIALLLYDSSASMRELLQLRFRNEGIDLVECYRQGLTDPTKQLGSLLGLSEVGTKADAPLVEKWIYHPILEVRLAAMIALTRLDPERAYPYALEGLESQTPKIRRLAIAFLSKTANAEVLGKARIIFQTGNIEQKKSMVQLFNAIGGWSVAADLLLTTLDPALAEMGWTYLSIWHNKSLRLFTNAPAQDLERYRVVYELVRKQESELKGYQLYLLENVAFIMRAI